ncbi:hypothetical protein LY01_01503 [Nonlabens xylanidelens]|uniref:YhhN-like protein n=2 Tax=Nonlabens xylanidelens TaxID=191564 RepID=A0A2S6IKP7_9FLAO|nr:hypothetical protein [Nonlabens xylanidelens]PPK94751.1 hypothetical protein LY01_01503 [Nonlabens xylanidelens]
MWIEIYKYLFNFYLFFLLLNICGYSAAIFLGGKKFIPILLYLMGALMAETGTYLIREDIITIFGEVTNAPFNTLFLTIQFLSFSYFYKTNIKNIWFQKYFYIIFCMISVIAYSIYIIDLNTFMTHNPWLSFITLPFLLLLSTVYFYDLLKGEKGYIFINIGIYMVTSSTLIFLSSATFYENINYDLLLIKKSLHITPILLLHTLLFYQIYLSFNKRKETVIVVK